uniref:AP2/ERF domain-containing protein n=1 Tax=Araucaria cunninghamii TaxID=56994 RepID=A0A0D6QTQ8_ARACU
MNTDTPAKEQSAHTSPEEKSRQYKGIRMRKWGKWVSEVRLPNSRDKIWLGSYDTAEQAACAYDAAVYCLRGSKTKFNFPNSIPAIPSASSLSREQIQVAAAKYALDQIPSNSNPNNKSVSTEETVSPSKSSSVSEIEPSCESQVVSEEQDSMLWESLLEDSDVNQGFNLEKLPSLDAPGMPDFLSPIEEQGSIIFDDQDLWSF